jgi:pyruvate kinase
VHAKAIVAFTNSGYTSQLISKFRPRVPIYSFTMKEEVQKLLTILWGVRPFIMKPLANADEMVSQVETHLKAKKLARKGDIIVIVASLPFNIHGKTNFMKLHKMS